ncbi:hypothetical protein GCM10027184_03090 [Saccharothrix stipae]
MQLVSTGNAVLRLRADVRGPMAVPLMSWDVAYFAASVDCCDDRAPSPTDCDREVRCRGLRAAARTRKLG